eukprot:TRINITY_DN4926_c2_g1_i1.p1 TRINITY_DN4926_c2_g1~~TRINITY_DN4926_c2_g1_i1.p1  ORF type:complete len:2382 (+),score=526.21 TRINITY_DN4926_c2_g1_i1:127-7272(+)
MPTSDPSVPVYDVGIPRNHDVELLDLDTVAFDVDVAGEFVGDEGFALIALQLIEACSAKRDEALADLQRWQTDVKHVSVGIVAGQGAGGGDHADELAKAYGAMNEAYERFKHYDESVDKARSKLRWFYNQARVAKHIDDAEEKAKTQGQSEPRLSDWIIKDPVVEEVDEATHTEFPLPPPLQSPSAAPFSLPSKAPPLAPVAASTSVLSRPPQPGGSQGAALRVLPPRCQAPVGSYDWAAIIIQANTRRYLVYRKYYPIRVWMHGYRVRTLRSHLTGWRRSVQATAHRNGHLICLAFAGILGHANIRALQRVYASQKLRGIREQRTLQNVFVMWSRYIMYIQTRIDKATGYREAQRRWANQPFYLWDEWVAADAAKNRHRGQAGVDKQGGSSEAWETCFRRWADYTRLKKAKRKRTAMARAHYTLTRIRTAFTSWVFVVMNRAQFSATATATLAYYLSRWVTFVRRYHDKERQTASMCLVSTLRFFAVWRTKADRLNVLRTAGMFQLLHRRPLALFALACLRSEGEVNLDYITHKCWRVWRSYVARRRFFTIFVATHHTARCAHLSRIVFRSWQNYVLLNDRKRAHKVRLVGPDALAPIPSDNDVKDMYREIRKEYLLQRSVSGLTGVMSKMDRLKDSVQKYAKLTVRGPDGNAAPTLFPGYLTPELKWQRTRTPLSDEIPEPPVERLRSKLMVTRREWRKWSATVQLNGDYLLFNKLLRLLHWVAIDTLELPAKLKNTAYSRSTIDPLIVPLSFIEVVKDGEAAEGAADDVPRHVAEQMQREKDLRDAKRFSLERAKVLLASLGPPFFNSRTGCVNHPACQAFFEEVRRSLFAVQQKRATRDRHLAARYVAQCTALRIARNNPCFTVPNLGPVENPFVTDMLMYPRNNFMYRGKKSAKGVQQKRMATNPAFNTDDPTVRQSPVLGVHNTYMSTGQGNYRRLPMLRFWTWNMFFSAMNERGSGVRRNIVEVQSLRLRMAKIHELLNYQFATLPHVHDTVAIDVQRRRVAAVSRVQCKTAFADSSALQQRFGALGKTLKGRALDTDLPYLSRRINYSVLDLVGFNPVLMRKRGQHMNKGRALVERARGLHEDSSTRLQRRNTYSPRAGNLGPPGLRLRAQSAVVTAARDTDEQHEKGFWDDDEFAEEVEEAEEEAQEDGEEQPDPMIQVEMASTATGQRKSRSTRDGSLAAGGEAHRGSNVSAASMNTEEFEREMDRQLAEEKRQLDERAKALRDAAAAEAMQVERDEILKEKEAERAAASAAAAATAAALNSNRTAEHEADITHLNSNLGADDVKRGSTLSVAGGRRSARSLVVYTEEDEPAPTGPPKAAESPGQKGKKKVAPKKAGAKKAGGKAGGKGKSPTGQATKAATDEPADTLYNMERNEGDEEEAAEGKPKTSGDEKEPEEEQEKAEEVVEEKRSLPSHISLSHTTWTTQTTRDPFENIEPLDIPDRPVKETKSAPLPELTQEEMEAKRIEMKEQAARMATYKRMVAAAEETNFNADALVDFAAEPAAASVASSAPLHSSAAGETGRLFAAEMLLRVSAKYSRLLNTKTSQLISELQRVVYPQREADVAMRKGEERIKRMTKTLNETLAAPLVDPSPIVEHVRPVSAAGPDMPRAGTPLKAMPAPSSTIACVLDKRKHKQKSPQRQRPVTPVSLVSSKKVGEQWHVCYVDLTPHGAATSPHRRPAALKKGEGGLCTAKASGSAEHRPRAVRPQRSPTFPPTPPPSKALRHVSTPPAAEGPSSPAALPDSPAPGEVELDASPQLEPQTPPQTPPQAAVGQAPGTPSAKPAVPARRKREGKNKSAQRTRTPQGQQEYGVRKVKAATPVRRALTRGAPSTPPRTPARNMMRSASQARHTPRSEKRGPEGVTPLAVVQSRRIRRHNLRGASPQAPSRPTSASSTATAKVPQTAPDRNAGDDNDNDNGVVRDDDTSVAASEGADQGLVEAEDGVQRKNSLRQQMEALGHDPSWGVSPMDDAMTEERAVRGQGGRPFRLTRVRPASAASHRKKYIPRATVYQNSTAAAPSYACRSLPLPTLAVAGGRRGQTPTEGNDAHFWRNAVVDGGKGLVLDSHTPAAPPPRDDEGQKLWEDWLVKIQIRCRAAAAERRAEAADEMEVRRELLLRQRQRAQAVMQEGAGEALAIVLQCTERIDDIDGLLDALDLRQRVTSDAETDTAPPTEPSRTTAARPKSAPLRVATQPSAARPPPLSPQGLSPSKVVRNNAYFKSLATAATLPFHDCYMAVVRAAADGRLPPAVVSPTDGVDAVVQTIGNAFKAGQARLSIALLRAARNAFAGEWWAHPNIANTSEDLWRWFHDHGSTAPPLRTAGSTSRVALVSSLNDIDDDTEELSVRWEFRSNKGAGSGSDASARRSPAPVQ